MPRETTIEMQGAAITVITHDKTDFTSLTDIANYRKSKKEKREKKRSGLAI